MMRKFWLVLVVPALFHTPPGMADTAVTFQAGKNYTVTDERVSQSPKVFEFFSYACTHCRLLDPTITSWASEAGKGVALTRIPVTFGNKQWEGYAKAFYVGEALNLQAVSHPALFELASHGGKLGSDEAIADFFVGLSVSREVTEQKINSPMVKNRMEQAEMLALRYKIRAVPSFVVNDKYFTDASMLGSPDAVPAALTQLTTLRE